MTPLRIVIGWDSKEPVAFEVFTHSLLCRSSGPLSIIPLVLGNLKGIYTRPRGAFDSTEFSMSRFLTPFLAGYEGLVIFADSDMLCRVDIYEILREVEQNPGKAVYCVKHDYTPKPDPKFLGQVQTIYEKKNWSSLMIMDAAKCKALTPEVVNTQSGLFLHRFHWLDNEDQIGALPVEWNYLVGDYEPNPNARIYHYTLGAPCFRECRNSDHADLWFEEYAHMNAPLVTPEYGHFAVAKAANYPVPPIGSRA